MQMPTFHEWFIYFFVHLFVASQLICLLYIVAHEWDAWMRWFETRLSQSLWAKISESSGRIRPVVWQNIREEFGLAFCLCGRRGRREGAKQHDKCSICAEDQVLGVRDFWWSVALQCTVLLQMPLHPASLKLAFAFPPAPYRCLKPVFFCIAHAPVEVQHGSIGKRRAKRMLAFKICQLETHV